MAILSFLGRGSAFNKDEDNTSGFFIKNNNLVIFDCGEQYF